MIQVEHLIYAPFGDDPILIDEVTITKVSDTSQKTGQKPTSIVHYELWDVNRLQLFTEWTRSGDEAIPGDNFRKDLNREFTQHVDYYPQDQLLIASMDPIRPNPPPRDQVSDMDWYPPPAFFVNLGDHPMNQTDIFTDQTYFFGKGTPASPDAVAKNLPGKMMRLEEGYSQNAIFVAKTDLTDKIQKIGDTVKLVYGFGFVPLGFNAKQLADKYRSTKSQNFQNHIKEWSQAVATVDLPDDFDQAIQFEKETLWRSYQLIANTLFLEYYNSHVIPQGSAYLYLHGADGAPRDQALFVLGAAYLHPQLAKESLQVIMQTADVVKGAMTYSFVGNGVCSTALDLHAWPSDLDIFLFLAVNEYLSATGDFGFLKEELPFHPKNETLIRPKGADGWTVLDHLRAAYYHLKDHVGIGEHGLVRLWDGDWDDGIAYEDPHPTAVALTIAKGESVPNSLMAIVALNRSADLLYPYDPEFSDELRQFAFNLEKPARDTFGDRWFGRAYVVNDRDKTYLKGNDQVSDPQFNSNFISLQPQPWGLLTHLLTTEEETRLITEIQQHLGSPIGPQIAPGGLVWPAIAQLMTWAYQDLGLVDLSWDNMRQHLYSTHADVYPTSWIGLMSGPDGWDNNPNSTYPGGTWSSVVTPMTDFPVSNMNPDGMFLMGLIRCLGININRGLPEPSFEVDLSKVAPASIPFSFRSPVFSLQVSDTLLNMTYTPHNEGELTFVVKKWDGQTWSEKYSLSPQVTIQFAVPLGE